MQSRIRSIDQDSVSLGYSHSPFSRICRPLMRAFVLLCVFCFAAFSAHGQNYLTATGQPSFAAPEPVELGNVDTSNGNLHLGITLGSYPQRGTSQPEPITLEYDSSVWSIAVIGNQAQWYPYPYPAAGNLGGWYLSSGSMAGGVPEGATQNCTQDEYWKDINGTVHAFHLKTSSNTGCPTEADSMASDSSGYHMYYWTNSPSQNIAVYAQDGTLVYTYPLTIAPNGNYLVSKDTNGNYMSTASTGQSLIDTLGRTFPSGALTGGGSYPLTVPTSQGTAQYTITTGNVTVKTNFQQGGVQEIATSFDVIRSIKLPDAAGSTYYFTYDCDDSTGNPACGSPSGQSAYYGELIGITLPSGGTVAYTYKVFSDAYGSKAEWVNTRVVAGGNWYYTPQVLTTCSATQVNCKQQSTVTSPSGTTIYTFQLNNGAWPISVVKKDLEGNTLTSVSNTWDFSQSCVLIGCYGASFIRLLSQQTTLYAPGVSLMKQVSYTYDSPQNGNQTAINEWRYIATGGFASTPDRATYITYLTTEANDINKPLSVTLCNNSGSSSSCPGGGSIVSQKLYTYDVYGSNGLTPITGIAEHDDTNFGVGYTTRGNVTSEADWVSGSTYRTTSYIYDTTGQIRSTTDPAGNLTSYNYGDKFYTDPGNNTAPPVFTPSTPTNAYLTNVTDAIGTQTMGYYWGGGKLAISIDYNGVQSTYHYQDGLDRQTEELDPVGWKLATYSSATQSDMYSAVGDTSASAGCSSCQHSQTILDSLGRTLSSVLVNNPIGEDSVNNTYDVTGRLASQSHPNTGSSDPNNVVESFGYDALNRQISTTHPDGQVQHAAFGANVSMLGGVTSQQGSVSTYGHGYPQIAEDESGHQRQQWTDGFGRVIEVDEPSTNTSTLGTATVNIGSGGGQEWVTFNPCSPYGGSCPQTEPNSGNVYLTVDGYIASAPYNPIGQNGYTTASQVASALAAVFDGDPDSPVNATANGRYPSEQSHSFRRVDCMLKLRHARCENGC